MCAAVEHWQGRHDEAHRRLAGACEDLADRDTPEAAALQIELAVDGLYELDHEQARRDGAAMRWRRARRLDDRGLVMAAAAALALAAASRETPAGAGASRARGRRARAAVRRRARAPAGHALPPRLGRELPRALRRRGRARRARRRAGARHRRGPAAGPAAARQGLPVRDAGPARRGAWSAARPPSRSRACRRTRTTCSGRCSSSPGRTTSRATSTGAIEACEESRASAAASSTLGTMPSAGGGPGLGAGGGAARDR